MPSDVTRSKAARSSPVARSTGRSHRARVAHGRSSDSGSRRDGRRTRLECTHTVSRSARGTSNRMRAGVLGGRPADRRAKTTDRACASARPDQGIVAVYDEHGLHREMRDLRRASALDHELEARRTGRAGRGRGSRGRPPLAGRVAGPSGRAPSSTSSRPSSASPAARRVDATPETRFAPSGCAPAETRPRDLGSHGRRRRLAVRRGDGGDAGGEPGRQPVDRAWIEFRQQLARHCHAGTCAEPTGEARNEPRRSNFRRRQHGSRVRDDRGTPIEGFTPHLTLPGEVPAPSAAYVAAA